MNACQQQSFVCADIIIHVMVGSDVRHQQQWWQFWQVLVLLRASSLSRSCERHAMLVLCWPCDSTATILLTSTHSCRCLAAKMTTSPSQLLLLLSPLVYVYQGALPQPAQRHESGICLPAWCAR